MNDLDLKILKTLISNKVYGLEFAYTYDVSLFCIENRLFAKLILDYMRAFRTVPTRRTLLEYHGSNEAIEKTVNTCWSVLENFEYNEVEYPFDLMRIKSRYEEWKLNEIKQELLKPTYAPDLTKNITLTIQNINAVKRGRAFVHRTAKEHLPRFKDQYIATTTTENASELVKTHYSGIDFVTDGFSPAELIIIGGESNAGKSMFLSNMSIQMWLQNNTIYNLDSFSPGYNVLYCSLEMPYDDCFNRFMARVADVNQRNLRKATLDDEARGRVAQAERFIDAYPYEFDIVDMPRHFTINELEMRYNDAALKYYPHIVVIDYLTLMESPGVPSEQDWLRLGDLAGELHEFGRAHNTIMITAAQLTDIKRNSKTDIKKRSEDQLIGMHRIGRSSLIMHHANVGIQIEKRSGEPRYSDLKYHIIKNRKGPLVKGFLTKNFANGALYDKSYIADEQNIDGSVEDISEKIKKFKNE